MSNRRKLWGSAVAVLIVLGSYLGARAALREDRPMGEITLMAPCDSEEHPMHVKKLVADIKSTFKLPPTSVVFTSAGIVTSDADRTTFVLTIKVEQSGKVVSSGQMQMTLDDGESANMATLCTVVPASGTYSVSADLRVSGAVHPLDSKTCRYTAQ